MNKTKCCEKCNGTGEINVPVTEHLGVVLYGKEMCDACDGTGEIEEDDGNDNQQDG